MIERDWNIQPPSGKCCITGRPFADEEMYYTMLNETPEGLARQDFSADAWAARNTSVRPLSFWRAEFKIPPAAPTRTIAHDDAESLLRRLIEGDDPATENTRYILAIMLERKKTFYHRDTVLREGRPWLVYEHKESGETFLIADPRLKLAQLHDVQQEVSELLRPKPPAVSAPAPAADAPGVPEAPPQGGAGEPAPEGDA
jgi:hypothetical protein